MKNSVEKEEGEGVTLLVFNSMERKVSIDMSSFSHVRGLPPRSDLSKSTSRSLPLMQPPPPVSLTGTCLRMSSMRGGLEPGGAIQPMSNTNALEIKKRHPTRNVGVLPPLEAPPSRCTTMRVSYARPSNIGKLNCAHDIIRILPGAAQ